MKRNLLFVFTLLVSLCASAQWTKPEITAADGAEMQFSDENDTICYYLYNKEADAFYTEGNDWGSRLSWTSEGLGLKCFFSKYLVADDESGETSWDGKTFFLNNYSLVKAKWEKAFICGEAEGYVDLNGRTAIYPDYFWECEKVGNTYRFFGADINPTYNHTTYPNSYLGINSDFQTTTLTPCLNMDGEETAEFCFVNWILVPVDFEYFDKLEIYNAAIDLGAYIEEVKANENAEELTSEIAAAETVYNNTNSTKEELEAAKKALRTALGYVSLKGASEDNPKDATTFIQNATFDTSIDGWIITVPASEVEELGWLAGNPTRPAQSHYNSPDDGVFIDNAIQVWGAGSTFPDGKMYQIMPSLPQGKYEFTVDACAVIEGNIGTACEGIELYAIGGEYEVSENISTGQYGSAGASVYYGVKKFKVTFISTGGDIELGARFENTTCNWIALDNFTLTYYGETEEDPDRVMLLDLVKKCENTYGDVDELKANADVKDAYAQLIEAAKTSTEGYIELKAALTDAANALSTSIEEYVLFASYIEEAESKSEEFDAKGWTTLAGDLSDLLMEWEDEYNNETADSEYIQGAKARMEEIIENGIRENMKAGDDVTMLLVNPDFEDGLNGWNYDENYSNVDRGGTDANHVVEKWYDNFYLYQDAQVPDGVYQLKVQGYFRPSGDGAASFLAYQNNPESEPVLGYFFINETAKKFRNIGSEYITETFDGRVVTAEWEGTTYYIPDNMPSASNIFLTGAYDNEVYGIVTDGKLRIGAFAYEGEGGRWTLFDNFRLIYQAKDVNILKEVLQQGINDCKALLNEENPMNATEKTSFLAQISDAEGILNSTDGDKMFAAYQSLIEAKASAETNISAYAELLTACEGLDEALITYAETADPSAVAEANQLFSEVCDAIEAGTYTTDEALAKINEIDDKKAALKVPSDYKSASDDNPYDLTSVIINPSFDYDGGSTYGWTLQCATYSNMQCQKNSSYPSSDQPTMSLFAEIWRAGAPLGDGYIKQTISYLPAGTYKVEADVLACDQTYNQITAENPYEIVGARLFAQESGLEITDTIALQTADSEPMHYGLIFKKANASTPLTIGLMTSGTNANWLAADNFQLTYYGTESQHQQTAIEGIDTRHTSLNPQPSTIFNLSGQPLTTPQKGINIINRKKVLVK